MGAGHLTTEVVVWGQGGGLTLACVVAGGPSVSGLLAPPKFSLPHRAVCFGAGGQLVLVCPHSPAEGQRPLVKLHSLEVRPSSQIHPWFRHWSCPFHPNVRHHSSPKWPPQQPSRPPATISSPALMASWASWCQPLPGHHSHSSFGPHLLFLWLHNSHVVHGLLTTIPFCRGGHGPYPSEGQICLPFRGAPIRRPYPSPESTTTLLSPFLPPRGGRCHLKDHPGHGASHDGLILMLGAYLNKAQRMVHQHC